MIAFGQQKDRLEHIIDCFASRRFFTGRWIVQELHFARKIEVYCGPRISSFVNILRTLRSTHLLWPTKMLGSCCRSLERIYNYKVRATMNNDPLSELCTLCDLQDLDCLDDRDRLFAIMTLWESRFILIDYRLSCDSL